MVILSTGFSTSYKCNNNSQFKLRKVSFRNARCTRVRNQDMELNFPPLPDSSQKQKKQQQQPDNGEQKPSQPETPKIDTSPIPPTPAYDQSPQVVDDEFSIAKVSFGKILAPSGGLFLIYGFGAYFDFFPGADISSIFLVYGFPATLLGFALQYAQLNPAPCYTTQAALKLRDAQMTDIQQQVRDDCTRFRYGDEQHLDLALERIFKFNRPGGIQRSQSPILVGLREEAFDGTYRLTLEFEDKLKDEVWRQSQPKFQSFFGPGITAELYRGKKGVEVALICDGSGQGRGGGERPDAMPPLMPGLQPRREGEAGPKM